MITPASLFYGASASSISAYLAETPPPPLPELADPHWDKVVLRIPFDGNVSDYAKGHTVTNTNFTISDTTAKFGKAITSGTNYGRILTVVSSDDFNFGSGDFTVEVWHYPISGVYTGPIISKYRTASPAGRGWEILRAGTTIDSYGSSNNEGADLWNFSIPNAVTYDTWHHFCLERAGSVVRLYIDGVMKAKQNVGTTPIYSNTTSIRIGAREGETTNTLRGAWDDIRITKGVARYNSDDGFEIPTEAYPIEFLAPPRTDLLKYWFAADKYVYADLEKTTLATDGQGVAVWGNLGSEEDATQSNASNRPIFKTGGLNGKPYIQCTHEDKQFFADLQGLTQPAGVAVGNPVTVVVVTDAISDLSVFPAILGSSDTNGGKAALYFRSPENAQIHYFKDSFRFGNVANPQILFVANRGQVFPDVAYNRLYYRQNGVSGTINISQNAPNAELSAYQFLRSTGLTTEGYFDGHLYEILIYDGVVDPPMWGIIERYLMNKYGFTYTPG